MIRSPQEALNLGIATVYQEITLCPNLSVAENIYIGRGTGSLRNWKKINTDADKILASNLPYGQQRKLEIARALATNPKLLLLDEPAAGMNPNETQELMDTIKYIQKHFDMTILLIEHDMKLVSGICEKLTVLNFGRILTEQLANQTRGPPVPSRLFTLCHATVCAYAEIGRAHV